MMQHDTTSNQTRNKDVECSSACDTVEESLSPVKEPEAACHNKPCHIKIVILFVLFLLVGISLLSTVYNILTYREIGQVASVMLLLEHEKVHPAFKLIHGEKTPGQSQTHGSEGEKSEEEEEEGNGKDRKLLCCPWDHPTYDHAVARWDGAGMVLFGGTHWQMCFEFNSKATEAMEDDLNYGNCCDYKCAVYHINTYGPHYGCEWVMHCE